MCFVCLRELSDDEIVAQFKQSFENPQFDLWNETSVGHAMLGSLGLYGTEGRCLTIDLLDRYIAWTLQQTPKTEFPSAKDIVELVQDLQKIKMMTPEEVNEARQYYHQETLRCIKHKKLALPSLNRLKKDPHPTETHPTNN